LTEDEVLQILDLVEKSNFDFLELQLGDLKLTVNKSGVPMTGGGGAPATVTVTEPAPSIAPAAPAVEAKAATPTAAPSPGQRVTVKEGTVPITAPMVGTFYAVHIDEIREALPALKRGESR